MVGGCDSRGAVNTTEALSLHTMTFTAGPMMLAARAGCAAFVLPQVHSPDRVLVVGGASSTEVLTAAG